MSFRARLTLVVILVLIMFLLHNSFWWWDLDQELPLLFGFMPFAFSYYVLYALLAVAVMGLIIKLAWPEPPKEVLKELDEAGYSEDDASAEPADQQITSALGGSDQ